MSERTVRRRASAAPGAARERERDDDAEFDKRDDDREYERPRRARRARDEEPRDDERGSRRRSRDDDDDDRPRRSRRDRDDDEPRGRGRTRDDDDDDGEDDDDTAGRGWKSFKNSGGGNFPDRLSPDDDPSLIKFLEDEPFIVYERHWVQSANRSYTCLKSVPKKLGGAKHCPLCDEVGDKPAERLAFNVAVLVENDKVLEEPKVVVWDVPPTVGADLRKKNDDDRKGPLSREYWEVTMSGKGKKGKTTYSIELVKERDLEDDWKIEPLSDDELDDMFDNLFDIDKHPYVNERAELEEVADDIANYRKRRGDDDEDEEDEDRGRSRSRRRRR